MFPWRTRYPLSQVPVKPVPNRDVGQAAIEELTALCLQNGALQAVYEL